jgi:hypothetical protein
MNGTMTRVAVSAELAAELARVTAFVMVNGASEGEFTSAECERVMELAGDEFAPMMDSAIVEFANANEYDAELTDELAHAFTIACGARGGVVSEFVIVSAAAAAMIAEFVAQR